MKETTKSDLIYLFWTGGYDSTFRLCELLIIEKKKVQPIYIYYNLDSIKTTDFWVRKNRSNEIKSMNKIKSILYKKAFELDFEFIFQLILFFSTLKRIDLVFEVKKGSLHLNIFVLYSIEKAIRWIRFRI